MKSFAVAMALGSAVLFGTAANANPVNAVTGSSQATDFSSQHHGGGHHRAQRVVRPSHHAPRHGYRRVHGDGYGGGHGGGAPGVTLGIGGGGHSGGGGAHR